MKKGYVKKLNYVPNAVGEEIHKEIQSSHFVLVDCWAPWCPPCKRIAPILEELNQEYGLKIVKVNADENEDFINEYEVLGLPTLLLFQDNQLVKRVTGFQPKAVLVEVLTELGFITCDL
ncbi:thioredoxin [Robertmurraya kyonggiensis]|uniref:Thioredoxin n=1 Tax=Robertmurraya kyonggiensis TaxID=1037680 RepID=A0A4U1D6H6_9BACI|nr:thioredoxin [Robertmurraya kyonggiensis]